MYDKIQGYKDQFIKMIPQSLGQTYKQTSPENPANLGNTKLGYTSGTYGPTPMGPPQPAMTNVSSGITGYNPNTGVVNTTGGSYHYNPSNNMVVGQGGAYYYNPRQDSLYSLAGMYGKKPRFGPPAITTTAPPTYQQPTEGIYPGEYPASTLSSAYGGSVIPSPYTTNDVYKYT